MERFFRQTRHVIALLVIIGGFGFLYLLALRAAPPENKDIIQVASGIVLAAIGGVVGYYFGASKTENDRAATPTPVDPTKTGK